MNSPPKRLVDDPSASDGLREAVELSAEAPANEYDADKGLARLRAAIVAAPAGPTGPDPVGPPQPAGPPAPNLPAPSAAAGGLAKSALWVIGTIGTIGVAAGLLFTDIPGVDPNAAETLAETPEMPAETTTETTAETTAETPAGAETPATAATGPTAPDEAAERELLVDDVDIGREERPEPVQEATPARSATPSATPNTDDLLRREIDQLAQTRQMLETRPARALALARAGQREFRGGIFGEERAALIVIALQELGRQRQAQAEAARFVQRYPNGPFTERVQAVIASQ